MKQKKGTVPVAVTSAIAVSILLTSMMGQALDWRHVAASQLSSAIITQNPLQFERWQQVDGVFDSFVLHPAIIQFGVDGGVSDFERNLDTVEWHLLTPLMLAIYYDQLDFASRMLSAEADVNLRSPDGMTALGIAQKFNRKKLVGLLEQAGAVPVTGSVPVFTDEVMLDRRSAPSRKKRAYLFRPNG